MADETRDTDSGERETPSGGGSAPDAGSPGGMGGAGVEGATGGKGPPGGLSPVQDDDEG